MNDKIVREALLDRMVHQVHVYNLVGESKRKKIRKKSRLA
ncbi:ATP-binding protein [Acinetobacter sp.]|nr:ATP-binding protein [Acinetobacter sp.]